MSGIQVLQELCVCGEELQVNLRDYGISTKFPLSLVIEGACSAELLTNDHGVVIELNAAGIRELRDALTPLLQRAEALGLTREGPGHEL